MNNFWLFVVQHYWLVVMSGFFIAMALGFRSGLNPNSFSRRLGRAGEAFWRALRESNPNTGKQ